MRLFVLPPFVPCLRSNIFSHQPKRSQQGRPILEMRGKDLFHGQLCPLRNCDVELRRRHMDFVSQSRVVKEIRFPTFGHNPARISHQRRECTDAEQFREDTSRSRSALACQRLAKLPRMRTFVGSSVSSRLASRLNTPSSSLCVAHQSDATENISAGVTFSIASATRPASMRSLTWRTRTGGAWRFSKSSTSVRRGVQRGLSDQLFGLAHVQGNPVRLSGGDIPPPRHFRHKDHLRDEITPDQGLFACRDQEVLLRFGKSVRQSRQRSDKPPAGTGRPTRTEHFVFSPGLLRTLHAKEVMRSYKQWIC